MEDYYDSDIRFFEPRIKQKRQSGKVNNTDKKYNKKFGRGSWSTEGIDFSDEQMEQVLEKCLQENRTFYDVIRINLRDLEDDEEI